MSAVDKDVQENANISYSLPGDSLFNIHPLRYSLPGTPSSKNISYSLPGDSLFNIHSLMYFLPEDSLFNIHPFRYS